jgi:anaerobic ribonucleoside-triphosphate reductase activating protein
MKKNILNVHDIIPSTEVNGPGKRFCLWVQGCHFNCKGCFNQKARLQIENKLMRTSSLVSMINETSDIEGVTFSGGEPFLQAEVLYNLSREITKSGLTIFIFTGFQLSELKTLADPYVVKLIGLADIIVDGVYKENIPSENLWTGSGNQRVHFLTEKYLDWENKIYGNHEVEIILDDRGGIKLTGTKNILNKN